MVFSINWDIVLYCVAMLLVIFGLSYFAAIATTTVPRRRGVLWQCAFRSNFAIIGLSLAGALGGNEAVAVAAIVSSFTVPLFNVLAVISLSAFTGGEKKNSIREIIGNIVKNPLIIAIVLGLVCLGIREARTALCTAGVGWSVRFFCRKGPDEGDRGRNCLADHDCSFAGNRRRHGLG